MIPLQIYIARPLWTAVDRARLAPVSIAVRGGQGTYFRRQISRPRVPVHRLSTVDFLPPICAYPPFFSLEAVMAQAQLGDTVHVHYTGRLTNGTMFHPDLRSTRGPALMPEMPAAGQHHRQAMLVGRGDHLGVPD